MIFSSERNMGVPSSAVPAICVEQAMLCDLNCMTVVVIGSIKKLNAGSGVHLDLDNEEQMKNCGRSMKPNFAVLKSNEEAASNRVDSVRKWI